jgi:hypothetical protein
MFRRMVCMDRAYRERIRGLNVSERNFREKIVCVCNTVKRRWTCVKVIDARWFDQNGGRTSAFIHELGDKATLHPLQRRPGSSPPHIHSASTRYVALRLGNRLRSHRRYACHTGRACASRALCEGCAVIGRKKGKHKGWIRIRLAETRELTRLEHKALGRQLLEPQLRVVMVQELAGILVTSNHHIRKRWNGFQRGDSTTSNIVSTISSLRFA